MTHANTSGANKLWKSCAWWPQDCCPAIGNYSEDTHYTEAEARGVCRLLHLNGFGGDGKFFPVKTEVVEIPAIEGPNTSGAGERPILKGER